MLLEFILPAITFALSAVSIPGPMQAYLLNVTLRAGLRRGLLVVFSPLLTDAPIIILTVFVLGTLPDAVVQLMRLFGGLLLLWIAYTAYKQYVSGATFMGAAQDAEAPAVLSVRRVLLTAMMMNFLSPGPYIFWATINGPLFLDALEISVWYGVAFLLAFYIPFIGGMAIIAVVINRLGRIGPGVTRTLIAVTMVLLIFFGVTLITTALGLDQVQVLNISLTLSLSFIAAGLMAGWLVLRGRRESAPHPRT